ncbi:DMT family transporter [Planococcus sp. N028]|uniref:DMT family transporter n=1 Tax=Planococcus shixiaomingii TaxID=3058393 RepID=A0ABT8N3B4_9BACL|nr:MULTISPECIES: DMT family transporter [unclassified Planococcus (in: firmicutes)]MDN7242365.1 DMT family transporter [Planococcus sp. N028]WKA54605.1 DMT family transporter [Planococcus sp. N022]
MKHLRLYIILVVVMFIWGMNLPALKYLTVQMGPVTMTSLRILLASITVFIVLFFSGLVRKPKKKEWIYIVGGSLLNVALHHYFISIGLSLTSGTNAGLILGTGPIMTAIFSLLLLHIAPSKWQWLGFLMGVFGVAATILAGSNGLSDISRGDLYILLAIISQVLSFVVITKAAKTLDPRLLTAYMLLLGSIELFVMGSIQEPGQWRMFGEMDAAFWLLILGSGIVATGLGHMTYNYSIGEVGPPKAAIFMNLNTLFALLGSVLFLGESINHNHLVGLLLIVGGVLFGSGVVEDWWTRRIETTAEQRKEEKVSRAKS